MLKKLEIHSIPTKIALCVKTAAITMVAVALFSQDLTILFTDALQSETTSHLIAIPFLFTYLIYRKRKMLRAVIPIEKGNEPKETRHIPLICGILLTLTSILLYWHGSYTFTPLEYHMLALPLFTAGLILILFNHQTLRQLAFPIAFLTFLVPPPSEILYAVGSTLSSLSSEVANAIMNAVGITSTLTSDYGNPAIVIARPDGTIMEFTVDIACSGVYSLLGFLIFAFFIAYIIRDKTWKKFALILLGIPLIYFLNIIRITIILALGYHFDEELALQIFHLLGGWILIFLGTILLLAVSEKIFKTQIFGDKKSNCPKCSPKPLTKETFCPKCGRLLKYPKVKLEKSDIAKIAGLSFMMIMLMSIQAPVFALTQTNPIIITNTPTGQQASTEILPKISNYTLYFAYRDTEFEQKAKQDMSLVYLYVPDNESEEIVWVAIELASTRSSLHGWETCLITWPLSKGYQPRVIQIELKDIKLNENPPIISRYFAFTYTDTNETQAVLYWYETTIFTVNQTSQQKNTKISLIAYPETLEDLPKIESQLVKIAKAITNYWQPIKTWSQVTMIISQNGATLTGISSIALMAVIAIYILENEKQTKANTSVYHKLSKINQNIVDILKETEKKRQATLNNIASAYKENTGKQISKTQLLKRLAEIEKIGIVRRAIGNENDEPIQIWKTKMK